VWQGLSPSRLRVVSDAFFPFAVAAKFAGKEGRKKEKKKGGKGREVVGARRAVASNSGREVERHVGEASRILRKAPVQLFPELKGLPLARFMVPVDLRGKEQGEGKKKKGGKQVILC